MIWAQSSAVPNTVSHEEWVFMLPEETVDHWSRLSCEVGVGKVTKSQVTARLSSHQDRTQQMAGSSQRSASIVVLLTQSVKAKWFYRYIVLFHSIY
jgi:hypothetical protein